MISLNMRDPLQNCPSGWSLYNTPTRSRSFGQTSAPGCSVATWTVNHTYSKVRGRALGFAKGTNDAFWAWTSHRNALNYADGMNIFLATASPQHVWTFAVDQVHDGLPRCPCTEGSLAIFPHFVGSHYFCDTHNNNNNTEVWDGVGCVAETCCDFNNPPWFSVTFGKTYTQDIEVRICTDENSTKGLL